MPIGNDSYHHKCLLVMTAPYTNAYWYWQLPSQMPIGTGSFHHKCLLILTASITSVYWYSSLNHARLSACGSLTAAKGRLSCGGWGRTVTIATRSQDARTSNCGSVLNRTKKLISSQSIQIGFGAYADSNLCGASSTGEYRSVEFSNDYRYTFTLPYVLMMCRATILLHVVPVDNKQHVCINFWYLPIQLLPLDFTSRLFQFSLFTYFSSVI